MRQNIVTNEEELQRQLIVGGHSTVLSLCSFVGITDDLLLVCSYHVAGLYLSSCTSCIVNI